MNQNHLRDLLRGVALFGLGWALLIALTCL